MEQRRELVTPITDEWLGEWILVRYWYGPKTDDDDVESKDADYVAAGPAEAREALMRLVEVNAVGIAVRHASDPPDVATFIPWSAVLQLRGPTREAMDLVRTEQTEEGSPT